MDNVFIFIAIAVVEIFTLAASFILGRMSFYAEFKDDIFDALEELDIIIEDNKKVAMLEKEFLEGFMKEDES